MHIKIYECGELAADRCFRVLPGGEIHVWYRRLDREFSNIDSFYALLSTEERARATRYRFDRHRQEFVVTRSTLRILLASYLGQSPENLAFTSSAQGKPSLEYEPDLRFNVSHTDGLAVVALVREHEIGVDVEKLRPECDTVKLAERFFSEKERQFLSSLSGNALYEGFFRCWTRKEAFIKAKGGGLSIPLDQFDVSIATGEAAMLLGTRPDAGEAARWTLYDLPARAGYAGALAVSATVAGLQGLLTQYPVAEKVAKP